MRISYGVEVIDAVVSSPESDSSPEGSVIQYLQTATRDNGGRGSEQQERWNGVFAKRRLRTDALDACERLRVEIEGLLSQFSHIADGLRAAQKEQ